ncbi:MAG: hypothetical protein KBS85_07180 [Lachnospiraceae bacterium]|nr:hypothetical protein [Candidatus Merdinaster equi]
MKNIERIRTMSEKELAHLIGIWNGGGEEREEKYLLWLDDEYDGTDGPSFKVEDMPMKRAEVANDNARVQKESNPPARGQKERFDRSDRIDFSDREKSEKSDFFDKNQNNHTPKDTSPHRPIDNHGNNGQRRRYRYRSRNK